MSYECPLCKQSVTKVIYERITGIWKEKEKHLEALREKEKTLLKKEKRLQEKFAKERQTIKKEEAKKFKAQLDEQKSQLQDQKKGIKNRFEKKLATAVERIKREEAKKEKELTAKLKVQFLADAQEKVKKKEQNLERQARLQKDRYLKLNTQFTTMQNKNRAQMDRQELKIKSLEEQIKSNKTPQVLGLLEEVNFLKELQENFPTDKFEHTGKGGDITHNIIEKEGEVGVILYELKKVSKFSQDHIRQTKEAKQLRKADYAILVTNAKLKDSVGFTISQGVIIIHPAASMTLISLLRNHIVTLSRLKLSKEQRNKKINDVLEYIQSPSFRNGIESIIQDTVDLYKGLEQEAKKHLENWGHRLKRYKNINMNARTIQGKAINLLLENNDKGTLIGKDEINPISLPEKIE